MKQKKKTKICKVSRETTKHRIQTKVSFTAIKKRIIKIALIYTQIQKARNSKNLTENKIILININHNPLDIFLLTSDILPAEYNLQKSYLQIFFYRYKMFHVEHNHKLKITIIFKQSGLHNFKHKLSTISG